MVVKQKCVVMEYVVFGKFVYDKGLTKKETIKIETLAGIKILKLNIKENKVETVKVDMGEPIFNPKDIPVRSNENPVKNLELEILDRKFKFTCISVGNPHAITFIKDVKEFELNKYGPIIETDSHFPKKINVEFNEIIDKQNIKMRVWERGTGETLACGTGACASIVAAIINGYTTRKVNVELLGGKLEIEWNEEDNHIYMTGPAIEIFEGEIKEI